MNTQIDRFAALLSERDRRVLAASGHGRAAGLRSPCALLVIDMTYDFIGDRPEDITESVKRFPQSCGAAGWEAAERLVPVLTEARERDVPVVYTVRSATHRPLEELSFGRKRRSPVNDAARVMAAEDEQVPSLIAPEPGDIVIAKSKPSAFFGTPLIEYLVGFGIRQVVCCGATTSGCVRATVVDAFSYGFGVAVIDDCTVDRWEISHSTGLFDMQQKYADLVSSKEVIDYLATSDGGTSPEKCPG